MTNQIAIGMKSGRRAVATAELILIRHGETDSPGTLNGRTDVGLLSRPEPVSLEVAALYVSPARRARETAAGLLPRLDAREDPRLWEQDFGVWDGLPLPELPDVGDLSLDELSALKIHGGESFAEMAARVRPALEDAARDALAANAAVAVVAHAGTVRAGLALAMGGDAAALAFQISYLGATRLRCYPGGFAVTAVNEVLT